MAKINTGFCALFTLLSVSLTPAFAGGNCEGWSKQCNGHWQKQAQINQQKPCSGGWQKQWNGDFWQKQAQMNQQRQCDGNWQNRCNENWQNKCQNNGQNQCQKNQWSQNQMQCPEKKWNNAPWSANEKQTESLIPENNNKGVRKWGNSTSLIEPGEGSLLLKSDGTVEHSFGVPSAEEYILNGDGTGKRRDGTVITKDFYDGSLIYSRPDGSSWSHKKDGSQVYRRPDGIQMIKNADESGLMKDRNGQILVRE